MNKTNQSQKIVAEIIYLFMIFFFCYTLVNKVIKIDSFKTNLIKTTLFSEEVADIFSVLVIVLEIVLILTLILYKSRGLLLVVFMMLIFTLYISFLRFKGLYEVCGCGGVLNGLQYKYHLLINIGLIVGSLFSFYSFNTIKVGK